MRPALAALTGLSLLALGACHRHDQDAAPTASAAPSAVAPSNAPPALPPPTRPPRRLGLWEQHMSTDGLEGVQTTALCIDAASEAHLPMAGPLSEAGRCSESHMLRKTDGSWAFSSVCDHGSGGKTTIAGAITGDATAYVVQADSTTTGAQTPQENGAHHVNITARWMGACKPGQKGGDLELPNGQTISLLAGR